MEHWWKLKISNWVGIERWKSEMRKLISCLTFFVSNVPVEIIICTLSNSLWKRSVLHVHGAENESKSIHRTHSILEKWIQIVMPFTSSVNKPNPAVDDKANLTISTFFCVPGRSPDCFWNGKVPRSELRRKGSKTEASKLKTQFPSKLSSLTVTFTTRPKQNSSPTNQPSALERKLLLHNNYHCWAVMRR